MSLNETSFREDAIEHNRFLTHQAKEKLYVSEQFPSTIQGEGPYSGRTVQFIRTGGCNLSCSWCDAWYTWDGDRANLREELTQTSVEDIVAKVVPGRPVVISGGEPLLHQNNPGWEYLLSGLAASGCEIHFETNGTIAPNDVTLLWGDYASVSPKIGVTMLRKNQKPDLNDAWLDIIRGDTRMGRTSTLKFVIETPEDIDRSVEYAQNFGWPLDRIWLMPLGTTTEELQERWPFIARKAADLGVCATHRTHILAFGDTKGT